MKNINRQPIRPGGEHDRFEEEVARELESLGFRVAKAGYHQVFPEEIADLLKLRFSLTALYVRMRADRVAIHSQLPVEFELEIKTNSGPHANMALEAFPLAVHRLLAEYGVRCLYVYRDITQNMEVGFWAGAMPPPVNVNIPDRWTGQEAEQFREILNRAFPGVPIRQIPWRWGSGDPFAVIAAEKVRCLPDWRSLVKELITSAGDSRPSK